MLIKSPFYLLIQSIWIFTFSNCFIVLPFNTIFIKNVSVSPQNDYRAQLLENDIYVNFSLGTPEQTISAILKMDIYGFYLYNGSFNKNLSSTYELIDNERRQNCIPQINTFTSYDYFNLPTFNSFSEYNKYFSNKNKDKQNKLKNIIKKERAEFLYAQKVKGSITKYNDMYEKFGIIGLKINSQKYYIPPEFVLTFKEMKDIKTHTFYLKFTDNKINGFANSNNNGYFIFGEELSEKESEKKNIKYTRARERLDQINWDLAFDDLISKSKKNDTIEYRPEYKHSELYVNFPYILGPRDYANFIRNEFFQELIMEDVCDYTYKLNEEEYGGYKCDGKSKLFLENLEKKFPDLIFEHKELEEKFILTGKDLFTYNMYNKSDTNLYFMILFPLKKDLYHPMSWILGIPFFKKYVLSFNYDNKMIGYLKQNDNGSTNKILSLKKEIIIISIFVFSIILAFTLGMYTHKRLNRTRKSKANELNDDNFEYVQNKNIEDEEQDNPKNNEDKKELFLSTKLIN